MVFEFFKKHDMSDFIHMNYWEIKAQIILVVSSQLEFFKSPMAHNFEFKRQQEIFLELISDLFSPFENKLVLKATFKVSIISPYRSFWSTTRFCTPRLFRIFFFSERMESVWFWERSFQEFLNRKIILKELWQSWWWAGIPWVTRFQTWLWSLMSLIF